MTTWTLILRSLRYHWRLHLGVVLGAAVGAAVLVGALFVGDSVRTTLREHALQRIGAFDLALRSGDRFFTTALAESVGDELGASAMPVLELRGIASTFDSTVRVGRVQILGMELPLGPDEVQINRRLAERMGIGAGDEILLRVEQPSAMPRDMVLAQTDEVALALRVRVESIADDDGYGGFSLEASQVPPLNAFVSLAWLQEKLDLPDRANMMLVGGVSDPAAADAALRRTWTLADAELEIVDLPDDGGAELLSRRIFIDQAIADAVTAGVKASPILTYFVNRIRVRDSFTPYSMVTALDGRGLTDDQIIINTWLADDLGAAPGDEVTLEYFIPGPDARLIEATGTFRVHAIVPLEGWAADRLLMPDFPGLADEDHCRDWEPGIPLDLDLIRDKDEAYWDEHRGTPKAFVSLAEGQRMWSNRFGRMTAIRATNADAIESVVLTNLDPAAVGLFFMNIREPALAAAAPTTDFGGLFLGLSFFLIVAAMLLTSLLFVLGVDQRRDEIGTLLAVGFTPSAVRRLFLKEAAVLAVVASVLGAGLGLVYTKLVLSGLTTLWPEAVGFAALELDARPVSAVIGVVSAVLAAMASIWLALRKQMHRPAIELLRSEAGIAPTSAPAGRRRLSLGIAIGGTIVAMVIVAFAGRDRGTVAMGAFFGAGSLLLIAGLAASRWLLSRPGRAGDDGVLKSISGLGMRNTLRRSGRSLATVGLLACGSFLMVSVGANRLDPLADADQRSSGTGGFALFGQSTMPVFDTETALEGVDAVPMRVRDGDEASCLNLNMAQQPRLVGVNPALLADRGAFTFAATLDAPTVDQPWRLLDAVLDDGAIPAIADQTSLQWALHKKIGDTIEYQDEHGRSFNVKLAGGVANSILQGNLLISEANFEKLFPTESGYRMFLIDAAPAQAADLSKSLTRSLAETGMEVTGAADRLADFYAVQNTYLAIFQLLGGLGLLLGSVGLGTVVIRNTLERRSEMALLRAVGFRARAIKWLVFSEHGLLLTLGLACGTVAALIAVIPALRSPGANVPYASTAVLLLLIAASGVAWVWLATVLAVRGRLIDALRGE